MRLAGGAQELASDPTPEQLVDVPVDRIDPSPYQVRVLFDDDELQALAGDVTRNGLTQPIILRKKPDGRYELVAGERRWLAARLAALDTIAARIRDLDNFAAHLIGVSENNHRADLSPWERAIEALGLQRHAEGVGRPHTQRDLAAYLNRNVATVNQQLAIAGAISSELLAGASVEPADLCRLTHETLHRIATLDPRQRAGALHVATRQRSGPRVADAASREPGAASPTPSTAESADRWTRLWELGGFQIHVRKPLRDVDPLKARMYVEQLLPGLGALALRVGEENGGGAMVEWKHERGRLLFLRPINELTAEQQREARDALRGLLGALEQAS